MPVASYLPDRLHKGRPVACVELTCLGHIDAKGCPSQIVKTFPHYETIFEALPRASRFTPDPIEYFRIAVLHDRAYRTKQSRSIVDGLTVPFTRWEADAMLWADLRYEVSSFWTRLAIWSWVRLTKAKVWEEAAP